MVFDFETTSKATCRPRDMNVEMPKTVAYARKCTCRQPRATRQDRLLWHGPGGHGRNDTRGIARKAWDTPILKQLTNCPGQLSPLPYLLTSGKAEAGSPPLAFEVPAWESRAMDTEVGRPQPGTPPSVSQRGRLTFHPIRQRPPRRVGVRMPFG